MFTSVMITLFIVKMPIREICLVSTVIYGHLQCFRQGRGVLCSQVPVVLVCSLHRLDCIFFAISVLTYMVNTEDGIENQSTNPSTLIDVE